MSRRVLVTGASSGIGRATVEALLDHGPGSFEVLATARAAEDLKELEALGAEAVRLDLQDASTIEATAEAAGDDLWGLVNNAGVAISGGVEDLAPEAWHDQMEINLIGPLDLTRRVLPHLRANRGRVVWVSSQLGRFTMPYMGAYCASKHAIEATADAMRMELRRDGVDVSVVAPGPVATRFNDNAKAQILDRIDIEHARHRELYEELLEWDGDMGAMEVGPEVVAEDIVAALASERPRARYQPGALSRWSGRLVRSLPARLRDGMMLKSYEG